MVPVFKDWAFDFDLSRYEEALIKVRSEAMVTKNFDNLDDLKDKLLKAGVEVRMSKDSVKLVPTLNFDLASIERIL
jgi:cysteinyl-tRNA synthetase